MLGCRLIVICAIISKSVFPWPVVPQQPIMKFDTSATLSDTELEVAKNVEISRGGPGGIFNTGSVGILQQPMMPAGSFEAPANLYLSDQHLLNTFGHLNEGQFAAGSINRLNFGSARTSVQGLEAPRRPIGYYKDISEDKINVEPYNEIPTALQMTSKIKDMKVEVPVIRPRFVAKTKDVSIPITLHRPVIKAVTKSVPIRVNIERPVLRKVDTPVLFKVPSYRPEAVPIDTPIPVPKIVKRPFQVSIPKPVPVPHYVDRPIPVPIVKSVPYHFADYKPVVVPVEKEVRIHIPKYKAVPVVVHKHVRIPIQKINKIPVVYNRNIYIPTERLNKVAVPFDKYVPTPVPVYKRIPIPFIQNMPVKVPIVRGIPVPVVQNVPVLQVIKKPFGVAVEQNFPVPVALNTQVPAQTPFSLEKGCATSEICEYVQPQPIPVDRIPPIVQLGQPTLQNQPQLHLAQPIGSLIRKPFNFPQFPQQSPQLHLGQPTQIGSLIRKPQSSLNFPQFPQQSPQLHLGQPTQIGSLIRKPQSSFNFPQFPQQSPHLQLGQSLKFGAQTSPFESLLGKPESSFNLPPQVQQMHFGEPVQIGSLIQKPFSQNQGSIDQAIPMSSFDRFSRRKPIIIRHEKVDHDITDVDIEHKIDVIGGLGEFSDGMGPMMINNVQPLFGQSAFGNRIMLKKRNTPSEAGVGYNGEVLDIKNESDIPVPPPSMRLKRTSNGTKMETKHSE